MSFKLKIIAFVIILMNVFFGAWTVLNGDIHFKSDVARDMLLFQEISQKKIVLLGPRASGIMGVYHGPLWLYLTYPAYILGGGNPVALGYYWIGLIVLGLIIGFVVAKKLYSEKAAWIYVIFLSAYFIQESKSLINPHGALLLMPLFYFFLVRYLESARPKYLLFHILTAGALIQFQMATGLPITILSAAIVSYFIIKKRKYLHFLIYPVICLPLVTFLIFELRHNFAQLHAILDSKKQGVQFENGFSDSLRQRAELIFGDGFQVFREPFRILAVIPAIIFGYFITMKIKYLPKRESRRYELFFYLYIGTFLFTLIIPGIMMSHQWIPLASLALLVLSSLERYFDKRVFIALLGLVVLQSVYFGYQEIAGTPKFNESRYDSWKFQKQLSDWIVQDGERDFGYFVYAPDIYAYGPKYTMSYLKLRHPERSISAFEKKAVTYVLYEPVPKDREDLSPFDWRKSKFGIYADPVYTKIFPNGYKIDKFILNESELLTPIDPDLDTGVFFR